MIDISKAKTAFFEQRQRLQAYLVSLTTDAHLAEDMVQEVWLAFSASRDRGDVIDNVPAWCRGVAKNLCMKHWRDKGRRPQHCSAEVMELVDRAFEEQDADELRLERQAALAACMDALPQHGRVLLEQKYDKNLSFAQMAKLSGKKESSLMVTLSRLRKKLKQCISAKLGGVA